MVTNVGQLLERRGKEFLSSRYKDPISSFSDFQEFSVSNPEVRKHKSLCIYRKVLLILSLVEFCLHHFAGLLGSCIK